MKMKNLILSISLFLGIGTGLYAQNPQVLASLPTFNIVGSDTVSNEADTATIGARMPYFVHRDPFFRSRPTMFNPSIFSWSVTGGTLNDYAGSPLVAVTGVPGFYPDSIVSVTMPGAAGTLTLSAAEQSRPKVGTGCTSGTTRTVGIQVVGNPSLTIGAAQNDTVGGCSAQATYSFTYTLQNGAGTNRGPFYVSYTVAAYDFATNAQIGSTQSYYCRIVTGEQFRVDDYQLAAAAGTTVATLPSADYRITFTGLWDKYSMRAMNAAAIAVDPVATNDLHVLVFPTPTTQPIKHIQRLQ